ncbi:conserved hypothetical protein [Vibrio nigripulchritudo SFn27]|nr:hypothetical protein [Vibrio nigripulchritudo]CCN81094.1 conserved hypothetical protein [Vibrio nigripulchritudo BLFn1]CCN86546.1 conserved hypothetical protein [Vibrio nigripulchritudo SFn27]CCN92879.1 conserved hypothetical protein [Vibrio nigripulchritudo ENn2]CCO40162.1 conserved hypothetical protein [Vibrio nigripulchritudo SFn135]CCO52373.1 conserved hypothetical protein [Vibrio nigripulchritudo Wn13]
MSLKDYIDIHDLFAKVLFFSFPLILGSILLIKLRATRPLRTSFFVFLPVAAIWWSFFAYDGFLLLKVESEIKEFVSNPDDEYSVFIDGKQEDAKPIIQSLRRISTKFTNKTFSSRTNKRLFNISRGNMSLNLKVFESSDKEMFYWVVYTVPGTSYEYIGRIRINEAN